MFLKLVVLLLIFLFIFEDTISLILNILISLVMVYLLVCFNILKVNRRRKSPENCGDFSEQNISASKISKTQFTIPNFQKITTQIIRYKKAPENQKVAYLNEWVDEILPNANAYLIQSEYDPIDIEGVDSGFSWGIFSGWVKFADGVLNGLGTLERKGDVTLTYEYPNLQLKVPIGFSRLQFFYDYQIKFMYIGPTGRVEGKSSNNKIILDINLNMITLMAKLNRFTVDTMGSISIVFRGSILTDWLVNTVVFTVTPLIKLILSGVIESFVVDTLVVLLNVYNDIVCALLENCPL